MTNYYYDFRRPMVPLSPKAQAMVDELQSKLKTEVEPIACIPIDGLTAVSIHHHGGTFIARHWPERGWWVNGDYYLDTGKAAIAIKKVLKQF